MQRIAFLMHIRPGAQEEYYSIFRDGLQLFAYLEGDDLDRCRAYLAESAVAARWEAHMSDILIRELDPATNFPPLLPEVFHLD